jgi:hypothetical protein
MCIKISSSDNIPGRPVGGGVSRDMTGIALSEMTTGEVVVFEDKHVIEGTWARY